MMWKLEFRRTAGSKWPGEWFVFTAGSLEDCLEDLLAFKRGDFQSSYDCGRLVWELSQ